MRPEIESAAFGMLATAAVLSSASICLFVDADEKSKQVQQNINNLTRLQLITALTSEENLKEDPQMKKLGIFSKTSNATKIMVAGGLTLTGAAAAKKFFYDDKQVPAEGEELKTVCGLNPITFGIGVSGIALTAAGVTKGTFEIVKANKALKAAPEELPAVADPAAPAEA